MFYTSLGFQQSKSTLIGQIILLLCACLRLSSRSGFGTPMVCQCKYSPLHEQPVGFEQMSRIPCRVIRLIYNHRHFQSPSPVWPRHYGARLQSNFVLSHRMSIRSCLCWRCAPLIFMSRAGITVASCWVLNMISEACAIHWTWSMHMWGQCMQPNTQTWALKYSREPESCGALTDLQWISFQLCGYKSQCLMFILHWFSSSYVVIHPKTFTATSLMDYLRAMMKCSLKDLWALDIWHKYTLIPQKDHIKFVIRFQDSTVKNTFICPCGGKIVCVCLGVCLWVSLHCFCQYLSRFDLRCVSPVYLGATWTALERSLSAGFPPQAKLVITFPGCHHFIAIHHYLELFCYIEPSDGDRHC